MDGAKLGLGVAAALAGLAAMGRRGSRSFSLANVDPADPGPPKWHFSVRYGIYPSPVSVDDKPHDLIAVEHGFIDDWNEVHVGVTQGGTQADLLALDPWRVDVADDDDEGPMVRTCNLRGPIETARILGLAEWVQGGGVIPDPLRLFMDLWGRTSHDFGMLEGRLALYGHATPQTTADSWTSILLFHEGAMEGADGPIPEQWIAYTVVLEPMRRVVLGGREVVKRWPRWAIPLYQALVIKNTVWKGVPISPRTRHDRRRRQDAMMATQRVEELVAAILGEPVEAVFRR